MDSIEKEINYTATNSYSTLNTLTEDTKTIWFVCHGMGYLSRYFLKYFKGLNPKENYIIAPQAPSKYYIPPKFHVGANWLTRDNTEQGTATIINYFDAVFNAEHIPNSKSLILFGYSQGVSVVMRYMVKQQLKPSQLILHSGGIPKELTAKDFEYLDDSTKVTLIYGTEDEFLDDERIAYERQRAQELFGNSIKIMPFEGKHIVNVEFINQLV
ncbi:MAG: esterase [Bacteroidota bacterium]